MNPHLLDQFQGCLLGLALGDALGAAYEGGPLERALWWAIGKTRDGHMRWTDDTQMSLDLADSIIALGRIDADDLAWRFAQSYRWSRGYGPGTAKVLRRIRSGTPWRQASVSVYRDGSLGNGAAMRAPVVGLFFAGRLAELGTAAQAAAVVTHSHPVGIEGSVLIAQAVALALQTDDPLSIVRGVQPVCQLQPFLQRLSQVERWLVAQAEPLPREVVRCLGHGVSALDSSVTALYVALRCLHQDFLRVPQLARQIGGDVDTIGAMAGAIWGAVHGASKLPDQALAKLEACARIRGTASSLADRAGKPT